MEIKRSTYLNTLLFLGIFYYIGIIGFIGRIITGETRNNMVLMDGMDILLDNAGGNIFSQVFGGIIIVLSFFYIIKFQKSFLQRLVSDYKIIVLVCGIVFLSITWSVEPAISFRRIVAISTIFLFSVVIAETFRPEHVIILIARLIGFCAIAGFIYVLLDPENGLVSEGIRENAFLGIYYDKNGGARAYAYAAIILFNNSIIRRCKQDVFLFTVTVIAVFFSQSATAMILSAVGCGLVYFFTILNSAKERLKSRLQVYFGFILLFFGIILSSLCISIILVVLGRDPTLTNRTVIWELLWPSVEDKFFLGYGYGAYWSSIYVEDFVERWSFIGNAHNGYLDTMLNGGLLMLLAFLAFLIVGVKKCIYSSTMYHGWNIFIPMWIVIIIMMLVNCVGTIIPNHKSLDMFLLVIIICFALRRVSKKGTEYAY